MSYTKQNWNTGDIVTAAKLNHIEDGLSAACTQDDVDNAFDEFESTHKTIVGIENNTLIIS